MDDQAVQTIVGVARAGCVPILVATTPSKNTYIVPGHGEHASSVVEINTEPGLLAPVHKSGKVTCSTRPASTWC